VELELRHQELDAANAGLLSRAESLQQLLQAASKQRAASLAELQSVAEANQQLEAAAGQAQAELAQLRRHAEELAGGLEAERQEGDRLECLVAEMQQQASAAPPQLFARTQELAESRRREAELAARLAAQQGEVSAASKELRQLVLAARAAGSLAQLQELQALPVSRARPPA
jgi:chromosome segregation ATPase